MEELGLDVRLRRTAVLVGSLAESFEMNHIDVCSVHLRGKIQDSKESDGLERQCTCLMLRCLVEGRMGWAR